MIINLSPYEKDRIVREDFGKTEMGRDLLAEDYILKQITASLIYPEDNLGKKFWDKVYTQAYRQYGTTNIPVDTFNKVWIVPDNAELYEKGNAVFLIKSHLKVMMEEDYLSLQKHTAIQSNKTHSIASKIVKEIVIPRLETEVNEGKNFAGLRQVFSGMILAAWYKRALKESLLGRIYANKSKVKGVDQDPKTNVEIYHRYLSAYKKGVFNFIKEDVDKYSNETIPRKYFSGGVGIGVPERYLEETPSDIGDPAVTAVLSNSNTDLVIQEFGEVGSGTPGFDGAMVAYQREILGLNLSGPVQADLTYFIRQYLTAVRGEARAYLSFRELIRFVSQMINDGDFTESLSSQILSFNTNPQTRFISKSTLETLRNLLRKVSVHEARIVLNFLNNVSVREMAGDQWHNTLAEVRAVEAFKVDAIAAGGRHYTYPNYPGYSVYVQPNPGLDNLTVTLSVNGSQLYEPILVSYERFYDWQLRLSQLDAGPNSTFRDLDGVIKDFDLLFRSFLQHVEPMGYRSNDTAEQNDALRDYVNGLHNLTVDVRRQTGDEEALYRESVAYLQRPIWSSVESDNLLHRGQEARRELGDMRERKREMEAEAPRYLAAFEGDSSVPLDYPDMVAVIPTRAINERQRLLKELRLYLRGLQHSLDGQLSPRIATITVNLEDPEGAIERAINIVIAQIHQMEMRAPRYAEALEYYSDAGFKMKELTLENANLLLMALGLPTAQDLRTAVNALNHTTLPVRILRRYVRERRASGGVLINGSYQNIYSLVPNLDSLSDAGLENLIGDPGFERVTRAALSEFFPDITPQEQPYADTDERLYNVPADVEAEVIAWGKALPLNTVLETPDRNQWVVGENGTLTERTGSAAPIPIAHLVDLENGSGARILEWNDPLRREALQVLETSVVIMPEGVLVSPYGINPRNREGASPLRWPSYSFYLRGREYSFQVDNQWREGNQWRMVVIHGLPTAFLSHMTTISHTELQVSGSSLNILGARSVAMENGTLAVVTNTQKVLIGFPDRAMNVQTHRLLLSGVGAALRLSLAFVGEVEPRSAMPPKLTPIRTSYVGHGGVLPEGGIDMNAANLTMDIKRDGNGVPLPVAQQNLENIHIDGLVPMISEIESANSSPLLSQLQVSGIRGKA